ncbi:MAG: hypothetical protein ACE5GI_00645 [Candidatus Aminicenantales bacterium]
MTQMVLFKKYTCALFSSPAIFCFLCFSLGALASPLFSQQGFTLTGNIGLGYYGRNPFLAGSGAWHYGQKFINLNLSGHIWDPRFLLFNIGGDYLGLNYGGQTAGSDSQNFGYRIQTQFFSRRKVSFGFRYGKKELRFEQILAQEGTFKTHSIEKGFDFSLSRVKILPEVKLNYTEREFLSDYSEENNELVKTVNLTADKSIGKSHVDLNYRYENHRNQFFELDRTNQMLRVTDKIDFGQGTMLWLNGIYSDYSTSLPSGLSIESNYGFFSSNLLKRFGSRFRGNFLYNYTYNSVSGYVSRAHNIGTTLNFTLKENIILTPEIYYFANSLSLPGEKDFITEPRIGLRFSFTGDVASIRLTSVLGVFYRQRTSELSGQLKDFSEFISLGIGMGKIRTLLAYLAYQYSGMEADLSRMNYEESFFFIGLGRKENSHRVRIELKSQAIGFLDLYLYSRYDAFRREYALRGMTDTRSLNNGLTLGFKGLSITGDYGISRLEFAGNRAEYNTFLFYLDMRIIRGLDLRVQTTKRERTDIFFAGDYELMHEAFLRYNLGRFSLSIAYRRLEGRISGLERKDEVVFIRFSRSFRMRF